MSSGSGWMCSAAARNAWKFSGWLVAPTVARSDVFFKLAWNGAMGCFSLPFLRHF
jgi:hypothetical protein